MGTWGDLAAAESPVPKRRLVRVHQSSSLKRLESWSLSSQLVQIAEHEKGEWFSSF